MKTTQTSSFVRVLKVLSPLFTVALSANAAFAKEETSWKCAPAQGAFNDYSLIASFDAQAEAKKVEVFHGGFFGNQKLSSLEFCSTTFPAPEVNDGSTEVTCHDGMWADSVQVRLSLGGFIPNIGTGILESEGPVSYVQIKDFVCRPF